MRDSLPYFFITYISRYLRSWRGIVVYPLPKVTCEEKGVASLSTTYHLTDSLVSCFFFLSFSLLLENVCGWLWLHFTCLGVTSPARASHRTYAVCLRSMCDFFLLWSFHTSLLSLSVPICWRRARKYVPYESGGPGRGRRRDYSCVVFLSHSRLYLIFPMCLIFFVGWGWV